MSEETLRLWLIDDLTASNFHAAMFVAAHVPPMWAEHWARVCKTIGKEH